MYLKILRSPIICETNFLNIDFYKLLISETVFHDVSIIEPRNLQWTREIISYILFQHSNDDIEKKNISYQIKYNKNMCWKEWNKYALTQSEEINKWVTDVFNLYPKSMLVEAFNNEIILS